MRPRLNHGFRGNLLLGVLANANEHVVPSQKHDVAVEICADVRIGLHDSLDVVSWIPLASLPMKFG